MVLPPCQLETEQPAGGLFINKWRFFPIPTCPLTRNNVGEPGSVKELGRALLPVSIDTTQHFIQK